MLVGQRIRILAKDGPMIGVIGKKATHLLGRGGAQEAIKLDQLWIDIGATVGTTPEAASAPATWR